MLRPVHVWRDRGQLFASIVEVRSNRIIVRHTAARPIGSGLGFEDLFDYQFHPDVALDQIDDYVAAWQGVRAAVAAELEP
jgi:hypothetical protein